MDKCPHILTRGKLGEGTDYCRESERPSGRIKTCHLFCGDECEIWEEIKKEEDNGRSITS